MAELSVILVSYNDRLHLEECLSSLEESCREIEIEIVVVDNKSTDGSPDLVKTQFPGVRLLENTDNVGFARACNQGISQSTGPFILFLNTDAVVNSGALNLIIGEIRNNPQTGAVGPALKTGEGSFQVSFGKRVDFFFAFIQKAVLNRFHARNLRSDGKRRSVGWLSAACLLVRREALKAAGFFDENYFLYFEDIDLCTRIKEMGWELIFLPQARMVHLGGAATSSAKTLSRYHYRKSQIYFYRKHNSAFSLFLLRMYLGLIFTFMPRPGAGEQKEGEIDRGSFYKLLKKGPE